MFSPFYAPLTHVHTWTRCSLLRDLHSRVCVCVVDCFQSALFGIVLWEAHQFSGPSIRHIRLTTQDVCSCVLRSRNVS